MNILYKIIGLICGVIIFQGGVDCRPDRRRSLGADGVERSPPVQSSGQTTTEKLPPAEDEDRKTLAQQVIDGKYGLIQTELFSSPVKRPGIISYEVNPEVPKDNINNLGGLKPEEIWLAENHLLVLKGGEYSDKEPGGKVSWPPIDNYIAPQRQVKIPPSPKIPPPFPIQLKEGGPIEIIKGKNNSGNNPDYLKGGGLGLFPEDKRKQGNSTRGNWGFPPPFPGLPPELGLFPPAVAFLLPPENLTQLDEDDPRLYYPPKYDFLYNSNYSSHVPPGPLVPGIILPPPPNFFAPLENNTRSGRLHVNKPSGSLKKPNKNRLTSQNLPRPKSINPLTKSTHSNRGHKIVSPIQVKNYENRHHKNQFNVSSEGWAPIPAPRPFYISDLGKLRALTYSQRNEHRIKYDGPKNGWDYENVTELTNVDNEISKVNDFRNFGKNKNPSTEVYDKPIAIPYPTSDRPLGNEHYTPQITTSKISQPFSQLGAVHKIRYNSSYERNNLRPTILSQLESAEKYLNHLKSGNFQDHTIPSLTIHSPSTLVDEERQTRQRNKQPERARGTYPSVSHLAAIPRPLDKYIYDKPFIEINTVAPLKTFDEATIKTPSTSERIPYYDYDIRNTVKPVSKPVSVFYFNQDSKLTNGDSGYSYDVPINPYIADPYKSQNQEENIKTYSSTTKKSPIYEYSFSAQGYSSLESPKLSISDITTPKPSALKTSLESIKESLFSFLDYPTYQSSSTTQPPVPSTVPAPLRTRSKYVEPLPFSQTENPYPSYNTHDLSLLDDITKKYFTLFGQRINPEGAREVTTSLPKVTDNYNGNYDPISSVSTKAPSTNIRFPEIYETQSERPYYENYSTEKFPVSNRKGNNKNKQINYSYYYSGRDTLPEEEPVNPYHSLESDINVNYKYPRPAPDPEAEVIREGYLAPGSSYVSYRLPGNAGHFYFLTPQSVPPLQSYPLPSPRLRYQHDYKKRAYLSHDFRNK